jgi:TrmH family RNA methyltransferase
MISLAKLTRLPRTQRLRKIAKIFGQAERRLSGVAETSPPEKARDLPSEAELLPALAELLLDTENFRPAVKGALEDARTVLRGDTIHETEKLRRCLNTIHHLLMAETGRYAADWDFTDTNGSLDPRKRQIFTGMGVYLEDIRSPFNVGAMFRSAESFGVEKIFLSPLCADPEHPRAQRTAMGCTSVLPWERLETDSFTAADFGGAPLFALETGGVPLEEFPFPSGGIMIAGSEELGVSPAALAAADASLGRVSIRTFGAKGSLNVSTAFGIAAQAWASALDKQ